jgi:hypothetical protein
MTVGRGDLDTGNDEHAIDRLTVGAHQPVRNHVVDRIARVVVGDGESVEPGRPGRGDLVLRTAHAVRGEEGMDIEVDTKGHAAALCALPSVQFSVFGVQWIRREEKAEG